MIKCPYVAHLIDTSVGILQQAVAGFSAHYYLMGPATPFHTLQDDEWAYLNLVENQMRPFFPKFVSAIAEQSPGEREQGRCAVIEFTDGAHPRTRIFDTSKSMKQYLDNLDTILPPAMDKPVKGRLFLLEDLPRNYILALGSRLNVPPSFFAGHYDDPATSSFNHRSPFRRCVTSQFRLRYATSNRVEVDAATHNDVYTFDTNVFRYLHVYNLNGIVYDEPRSHHNLSFWSCLPKEDGSWNAMLLLDPPPRNFVRYLGTRSRAPIRKPALQNPSMPLNYLYPEFQDLHELPKGPGRSAEHVFMPEYVSMFDDTLSSFEHQPRWQDLQHAYKVVEVPRKLVLSINIAFLRRRYLNLIAIQKTKVQPQALRSNYLSSFSTGSFSCWNDQVFNFIVGARSAMHELGREMEENLTALGLDAENVDAPQWEIDGWKSVIDLTRLVQETLNAFATGYMQYVSIEEAHVSNENARNLSKITVLTMFFIPLSTVASIFSMGGGFLPGGTESWVFWVVAIPVLALLSCLYWYRSLAKTFRVRSRKILPLFNTSKDVTFGD
jgi:hypothetical protein